MRLPTPEYSTVSPNRLPSWVPDWRVYQSHILSEPTSPHQAGGRISSCLELDRTSKVLRVDGVFVDIVAACSDPFRPREFHVDGSHWSEAFQKTWHDVCSHASFGLATKYRPHARFPRSGESREEGEPRDLEESAVYAYVQTLSNACVAIAWQDNQPYDSVPTRQWLAHGAAYLVCAAARNSRGISAGLQSLAENGDAAKWARAANGASGNRAFAGTTKGYYVLGPRLMNPGDLICVMKGAKIPFCLRPWGSKFLLVGECYVHGIMDGRMFETAEADGTEVFEIV